MPTRARPTPKALAAGRRGAAPVVLDSSCWLEHFADTDRAALFAKPLGAVESLVVPVITVYEVVKKLAREAGDEVAAAALTLMHQGRVVGVDLNLALAATRNGLPLADSLIYATAQAHGAQLWTQDAHFDGLPGVRYFAKP
jgi:toxin FitB